MKTYMMTLLVLNCMQKKKTGEFDGRGFWRATVITLQSLWHYVRSHNGWHQRGYTGDDDDIYWPVMGRHASVYSPDHSEGAVSDGSVGLVVDRVCSGRLRRVVRLLLSVKKLLGGAGLLVVADRTAVRGALHQRHGHPRVSARADHSHNRTSVTVKSANSGARAHTFGRRVWGARTTTWGMCRRAVIRAYKKKPSSVLAYTWRTSVDCCFILYSASAVVLPTRPYRDNRDGRLKKKKKSYNNKECKYNIHYCCLQARARAPHTRRRR